MLVYRELVWAKNRVFSMCLGVGLRRGKRHIQPTGNYGNTTGLRVCHRTWISVERCGLNTPITCGLVWVQPSLKMWFDVGWAGSLKMWFDVGSTRHDTC